MRTPNLKAGVLRGNYAICDGNKRYRYASGTGLAQQKQHCSTAAQENGDWRGRQAEAGRTFEPIDLLLQTRNLLLGVTRSRLRLFSVQRSACQCPCRLAVCRVPCAARARGVGCRVSECGRHRHRVSTVTGFHCCMVTSLHRCIVALLHCCKITGSGRWADGRWQRAESSGHINKY